MRVAVVIPTYNRHGEVRRAVESVLKNEVEVEVLVGDDGSSPPVRLPLPSTRVVRFEHTGNPSLIRNRLVEMSDAPLVAFLDDDDEFLPGKLDAQVQHLLSGEYAATFSNVVVVDARTGETVGLAYGESERPLRDRILFPFRKDGVVVQVGALLVRREVFLSLGGFNENLTLLEDWEFSLRLALRDLLHFHNFPGLIHYQNRRDSLRTAQLPTVAHRYETLMAVVSEYLPPSLTRWVKAHFYGALSYRLSRIGRRGEAISYALKSLRYGGSLMAVKGAIRSLLLPPP